MPGLSGGGGDTYTGDPGDAGGDDSYDPGRDPTPIPDDPEPSAGGGLDGGAGDSYTGGADDFDGGSDADPEPSTPAGPGLDPGAGGGGSPEPEPTTETTRLDRLGQAYTDTVAEPVGDVTAATNPIAQAEQATLGTDRIASLSEGVGEGVAQIGNVPGNTAAAIDAGQTLARARGRATDPVTIGGVPTGVTVPNLEGQTENTEAAAGAGAAAAASAAESPFETTGRVIGGALGGAAASRGIARVASRAGSGSGSSSGAVPSGRSQVGTGGRGSLLDEIDVDAERGISGPSRASRVRGEVSRAADDATARLGDSRLGDFVEDTRAQLQQSRGTGGTDFGDVPDRTRPADAGGTFEDIRQDALTEAQDQLRSDATRPNPGTFDDAPQPFRDRGGDTIDADAGVQLQRSTATPDLDVGAVDDATTLGAGATASASRLGVLAGVNDPTDIAGTAAVTGSQSGADTRGGTGAGGLGTLGTLDGVNDPTQVAPTGDTDSGTGVGDQIGTGTTGGLGTDTVTDTGTTGPGDGDTRTEPIPQLRASTTLGTQQAPGSVAETDTGSAALATPDTATDVGADGFTPARGVGFGGGAASTRGPRGEEEGQPEEDDGTLFGLTVDAAELDSGIASGGERLRDLGFELGAR